MRTHAPPSASPSGVQYTLGRMAFALLGAAVLLIAAGLLRVQPFPVLWGLLGASAGCFALVRRTQRQAPRAVWFNVGFVFLALAAGEAWCALREIQQDRHQARYHGVSLYETQPDPLLGYRLLASSSRQAARYFDDTEIYRATYTTGPDGWRIAAAPGSVRPDEPSIVFFGGSFTYGEGLDDQETLPWLTGVALGNRFQIHNLGVHGYGPQHMLAQLESGLLEDVAGSPSHVIYSAIRDHVVRAVGRPSYLETSPHYLLQPDGSLARSSAEAAARAAGPWSGFGESRLVRALRDQTWAVPAHEIATFVAIVQRSRDLLRERHPGCSFDVIFWDSPGNSLSEAMVGGLRAAGLRVHRVTAILEGYPDDRYALSPHDGHPSALANHLLADYIAREIVGAGEAPSARHGAGSPVPGADGR